MKKEQNNDIEVFDKLELNGLKVQAEILLTNTSFLITFYFCLFA